MFGIGARFGTLILAAAILFIALRIHKSAGKHVKVTKPIGIVLSFISGSLALLTVVGSWMGQLASVGGVVGVAGLIVCAGIVIIDWGLDKKPDKPAFWAAFALAAFIVFGVAQIPTATSQIKDGTTQVTSQLPNGGK